MNILDQLPHRAAEIAFIRWWDTNTIACLLLEVLREDGSGDWQDRLIDFFERQAAAEIGFSVE